MDQTEQIQPISNTHTLITPCLVKDHSLMLADLFGIHSLMLADLFGIPCLKHSATLIHLPLSKKVSTHLLSKSFQTVCLFLTDVPTLWTMVFLFKAPVHEATLSQHQTFFYLIPFQVSSI